jgi:hypothetical protein
MRGFRERGGVSTLTVLGLLLGMPACSTGPGPTEPSTPRPSLEVNISGPEWKKANNKGGRFGCGWRTTVSVSGGATGEFMAFLGGSASWALYDSDSGEQIRGHNGPLSLNQIFRSGSFLTGTTTESDVWRWERRDGGGDFTARIDFQYMLCRAGEDPSLFFGDCWEAQKARGFPSTTVVVECRQVAPPS